MFEQLKKYFREYVPLTEAELELVDTHFEVRELKKKEFLLQDNQICDFIAFIVSGSVRHFHVKEGNEKTCDISFEGSWVTDFQSFKSKNHSIMNLQAMEATTIYLIRRQHLAQIYQECSKYETFGRLMAEQVAQRATDIAMSLSSEKPEERFQKLVQKQPDLFQRIPQKYIANFLGISPESLSRIRKRIFEKRKS